MPIMPAPAEPMEAPRILWKVNRCRVRRVPRPVRITGCQVPSLGASKVTARPSLVRCTSATGTMRGVRIPGAV